MSFVDRTYPDVVGDVLANLTQGVTREVHRIDYDATARPVVVPDVVLKRRPVKRVSRLSGFVAGKGADVPPVAVSFTPSDYELLPAGDDPGDRSRIRFLPFAKQRPAPGTDVTVNYYPRTTDPTPLTDLNVGSVVRTLAEAVSKEIALLYAQLNLAYDSAFVETAAGSSLDRVVALLGCMRFQAGRPVGTVTFTRRAGAVGNITIPAGTPVTDAADKIRYETVERYDLLAGETTAQVRVRGAAAATPVVEPGQLSVVQRAIAGIDKVVNERPTTRASEDETDEELRARARDALLAASKGTVPALRFGLLQLPEVRDVQVIEMPNGVPGEVRLRVTLAEPGPGGALPDAVRRRLMDRVEALRPAGVRVLVEGAGSTSLTAKVDLVLAGSRLPPAEVEAVQKSVSDRLRAEIGKKGVGEKVRVKPLVAALLSDTRIADAALTLGTKGAGALGAGEDFQPDAGSSVTLEGADVSFGPEVFDQPLAADETVPVEVRAQVGASPLAGVPLEQVKAQITGRLTDVFGRLSPGAAVDTQALLNVLRDDAKYGLDPLRLRITLTSADQFAQILQGGPAYTVLAGQVFTIASVEVTA